MRSFPSPGTSPSTSKRGRGRERERRRETTTKEKYEDLPGFSVRRAIALALALALASLALRLTGYSLTSAVYGILGSTTTSRMTHILSGSHSLVEAFGPDVEADSLRALVRNVTTDMDQLISIVEDFLESQEETNPGLDAAFRTFISDRASSSFISVERTLDSILWLYKFLLPFLFVSLLGNAFSFTNKRRSSQSERGGHMGQEGGRSRSLSSRKQKAARTTGLYARSYSSPASVQDFDDAAY